MLDLNSLKLSHSKQTGFTLLEVIIVLALIGLILSSVRYAVFTGNVEKDIEKEVRRLQVVFNMASDFAVINQLELGLIIDDEDQSYEFVKLDDDERWVPLDNQKHFTKVLFTEGVSLEISLEGLAWQDDDSLFDNRIFDEELSVSDDGVDIGNEEDKVPPPPQIIILSSGEITPFELSIKYEPQEIGDEPFEFILQGLETVPLKLVNPE
ncbi:MAG: general secretion pathway protein H [Alphaproteobacteria bacterium]